MIQLDFFEDIDSTEYLNEEIKKIKTSTDKVRKSLFAKHGQLSALYIELSARLDLLERNICNGK